MSILDQIDVKPSAACRRPLSFFSRTPEKVLIAALRKALKDYDRATRPDGRRLNGTRRVDPQAVAKGLKLLKRGTSIRKAAAEVGVSFGTLWIAKELAARNRASFKAQFRR